MAWFGEEHTELKLFENFVNSKKKSWDMRILETVLGVKPRSGLLHKKYWALLIVLKNWVLSD